jgi:leucine dehydrogenase
VGERFEDLLGAWDGEEVVIRVDHAGPTWMLVGVHSTALGPGFGGTRMKVYPDPAAALEDVLRLSAAMTAKNALVGLPFGGGKAVLAVPSIPEGEERRRLLLGYGELVTSLGGTYRTACDMNTRARDMDVVAETCPFVFGRTEGAGGSGDSGPSTAQGVFHAIRAAADHAFGSSELGGRRIVVQGAGAVGRVLVGLLIEAGAELVVSDLDGARADAVARRAWGRTVPPERAYEEPCDVFAPCATGGVLNAETIPRLRCRLVVGAANNQLATPEDAQRLRDAGILYVPDFAANAGGVLHLAGLEALGWSRDELADRLRGIGDTVSGILATADADGVATTEAAERIVRRRLEAGDPSA